MNKINKLISCLNCCVQQYLYVEQFDIDENMFTQYTVEEISNTLDNSCEVSGNVIYQLSTLSGEKIAKIEEICEDGGIDDINFIEIENFELLNIIKENYLTIVFEMIKEKILS